MSVPADQRFETPAGYEGWKADEKAEWLWNELILATAYSPVTRPDLAVSFPTMLKVAASRPALERTLDHTGDLMEIDRPKIIHPQGSVAMVRLETLGDSPFTGVLAPPPVGGARGLMRMSLSCPPEGRNAFIPGFGLKLLVDGQPSLDTLAVNHTVGQGRDVNMFANTFTHDLRDEHKELRFPQKTMNFFFKRVATEPRHLLIDHFAETTRAGDTVAEPARPHRLRFRPDAEVRRRFRARHVEDFRESLARLEPDTVLYDVESVDERGDTRRIGRLVLDTEFVASLGGDRVFFRHVISPDERVRS